MVRLQAFRFYERSDHSIGIFVLLEAGIKKAGFELSAMVLTRKSKS